MIDKYRPIDSTPTTVSSAGRVLVLLWVFGAFLALYTAADLHAWLAWDEEASPAEQQLGKGLLSAGRASGLVPVRERLEGSFAWWRDPPRVLRRQLPPPSPVPDPEPEDTDRAAPAEARVAPQADPPAPRRILLVGASSINHHLGVELERCLDAYDDLDVLREGQLGTGLGRPDAFDWPAEIDKLQDEFHPDLVLGQFGGNDCQPATDPKTGQRWLFGTSAWDVEYERRVRALSEAVTARGADMGFLGQLAVRRPGNRRCSKRVDKATRLGAEAGGAWYLDTRDLTLAGPDAVLETVVGERGVRHKMWTSDDQHVTREGAQVIAGQICLQLERRLSLKNPDPDKARVYRFETPSQARGRTVPWYAVVPSVVPPEGLPVLFLLHGAGGSAEDWMGSQASLQRMAVQHGLVFVSVDGDAFGWYVDGLPPNTGVETYLIDELIPQVEARLPVNDRRGITGLSMGGHGALVLALRHPGTFVSASSMSGVVDLTYVQGGKGVTRVLGPYEDVPDRWKAHSARHILDANRAAWDDLAVKFSCGTEDAFLGINRALHRALKQKEVPHTYDEGPGAHDWGYWNAQLPEHVAWHAAQLSR